MKKRKVVPRAVFEELYFSKGLSHKEIAMRLGLSEPTIRSRFKEYGFVAKKRGSWAIKYQKTAFCGDNREKAYILGFRAGDLNVYRPPGNSNIIVARTNSTCHEQIELMHVLFGRYGGVKVCGNDKAKNINCYLDESFSFLLLNKPYHVEAWIKNNQKNSLAFMAGYIDAEGNFIINQRKARFKLDAYDATILQWMHEWLIANGIKSKMRLIGKRGDKRYGGGYWNDDLWRININEAHSLLRFCNLISPYMRHKKRVFNMNECLENINYRKANGTI